MATWKKLVTEDSSNHIAQTAQAASTLNPGFKYQLASNGDVTSSESVIITAAANAQGNPQTFSVVASIGDGKVTSAKIATGGVATSNIADSAVTTIKILDSAVTTAKINDDAVTTTKILNANITTDKIANYAITPLKISNSSNDDFTFPNHVIVAGDLTVQGVTTTINTDTLVVEDNIIQIAHNPSNNLAYTSLTSGAGITISDSASNAPKLLFTYAPSIDNEVGIGWTLKRGGTENYFSGVTASAINYAITPMVYYDAAPSNQNGNSTLGNLGTLWFDSSTGSIYVKTANESGA